MRNEDWIETRFQLIWHSFIDRFNGHRPNRASALKWKVSFHLLN